MRWLLVMTLALGLAACSDDSSATTVDSSTTTDTSGPRAYGADADATPITTPEGETVYLQDDSIYGPCDLIEPHKADIAGWLHKDPPSGHSDYGYVCT